LEFRNDFFKPQIEIRDSFSRYAVTVKLCKEFSKI
jgi:hypothetical protein